MFTGSDALFCVCKNDASPAAMQKAIDYACRQGRRLHPDHANGPCNNPSTIVAHCSLRLQLLLPEERRHGRHLRLHRRRNPHRRGPQRRRLQVPRQRKRRRHRDRRWDRHRDRHRHRHRDGDRNSPWRGHGHRDRHWRGYRRRRHGWHRRHRPRSAGRHEHRDAGEPVRRRVRSVVATA
ncbi:hypothetical protein ACQ4PT_030557 [Festuca glaucescens]